MGFLAPGLMPAMSASSSRALISEASFLCSFGQRSLVNRSASNRGEIGIGLCFGVAERPKINLVTLDKALLHARLFLKRLSSPWLLELNDIARPDPLWADCPKLFRLGPGRRKASARDRAEKQAQLA